MSQPRRKLVLLYGGTFDPVHNGHISILWQVYWQLQAEQVYLIPCAIPPHKTRPRTTTEARVAMLDIVVAELNHAAAQPVFAIDTQELQRSHVSYTLDTLVASRQFWGEEVCLVWLLGGDSWQNLSKWHRWQELTDYAHLAVVKRPGVTGLLHEEHLRWCEPRLAAVQQLRESAQGRIVMLETTELAIASADIRRQRAAGMRPIGLVPAAVDNYIQRAGLYLTQN